MTRFLALIALVPATLSLCGPARAGEASARHAAWQSCLDGNFRLQARLTSRVLAADAAFRACGEAEKAYLDALAASPFLDGEEAGQIRPALLARARGRLLGRQASL